MLIFCHLFAGLVLGLFLNRVSGQKWTLWACALGSVLPDLLDKPLGHIFLSDTLDNGRLLSHTLLFFGVFLIAGLASWRRQGRFPILALAAGIMLHQVLDTMFLDPITWCWPFLGPFPIMSYPDYFGQFLVEELSSVYEWFFGAFSLAIILQYAHRHGWSGWRLLERRRACLMSITWCMLLFAAVAVLYAIITADGSDPGKTGQILIASLVATTGGLGLEISSEKSEKME